MCMSTIGTVLTLECKLTFAQFTGIKRSLLAIIIKIQSLRMRIFFALKMLDLMLITE